MICLAGRIDSLFILTVFNGVDQRGSDEPQLFETLLSVNGTSTGVAVRSATWEQAEREHRRIVFNARVQSDT